MKKIRLFRSYISPYAMWNVCTLLIRSNLGAFIGEGPQVKAFETELAKRFELKHVALVNSGTAALELAYELAGIGPGDEVITPILTCTATNLPLLHRGASVVFADIDRDLNIRVDDVRKKITPRTKAIVFVHFGGNNRGLRELLEIAREKGLTLIEDAAQAIASDFWGKADFTCVSFQAIKTLTTTDGGMLVCNDASLHEKAKRLRWFGYDRDKKHLLGDTDLIEAGYKYHMNDVSAAIGLGNLKAFDKITAHHRRLMNAYREAGITAYPWFALVLSDRRDALRAYLKENGIDSGMHHYRNDIYTIFGGRQPAGSFPVMEELENKYLLLPLHMWVRVSDVRRIAKLMRDFDEKWQLS